MANDEAKLRDVPGWSIIRLPDGKIGVLRADAFVNGKCVVQFTDKTAAFYKPTTRVAILAYMADLVYAEMSRLETKE